MPYVLTADQIASRARPDLVTSTMTALSRSYPGSSITRTVGDEFELLFSPDRSSMDDTRAISEPNGTALSVVDAILGLMRGGDWHLGVGLGAVDTPTPADLREARGPAFLAARRAVEEAKDRPDHLRLVAMAAHDGAADPGEVYDAETLLRLVLALRARRSAAGWQAADLADQGLTQAAIAERLEISRQAVNQRLQAAQWGLDRQARPVAARLLARAERRAGDPVGGLSG